MDEPTRWVPYCGEAPGPEVWLSRWNLDPVLGAGLLLLALALRHPQAGRDATPGQRRSLRCAWAMTVLLCALSSTFFTLRVVQHIVLVLVMAPLLAFGMEPWLRRLPTPLWTSTAIAAVTFWTWHAPAPYAAALSSVSIYALMQFTLLASATGFWIAVRRSVPAAAMGAILATMVLMGLLGALITFAERPLYASAVCPALRVDADYELGCVAAGRPTARRHHDVGAGQYRLPGRRAIDRLALDAL